MTIHQCLADTFLPAIRPLGEGTLGNDTFSGFSNRSDGNMSPKYSSEECWKEHISDFLLKQRIIAPRVAVQVNAQCANVRLVQDIDFLNNHWALIGPCDAMITNETGLALVVTSADCLPICISDETSGAIGLVHAGWKGLLGGVISNTISAMSKAFGSHPENLAVSIGPGIQSCCFNVKTDVASQFEGLGYGTFLNTRCGEQATFIDLVGVAQHQLLHCGVATDIVNVANECTCCNSKYFSYRRERTQRAGSNATVLMRQSRDSFIR